MLMLSGLVVLYFFSRLYHLLIIPIFADEAIYIKWAQLVLKGQIFIPLTDGKTPLFMWLLAPFLKLNFDPLLIGRLLSVFSGFFTLIAVYLIAQKLFNSKIAFLAALLIIFQPLLLFYDRMSLVDSLLTSLIIWSFFIFLNLIQKPSLKTASLLGLFWSLSLLTKPSAALYLVLMPFFLIVKPIKKIKSFLPFLGLSFIVAAIVYNLQRISNAFHLINQRSADYLRSSEEILTNFFEFFPPTLKTVLSWLIPYFSWVLIIILFLSLIWALLKKQKKILILCFFVFLPIIIQSSIGKIIYPRYFLPLVPFLILIISWGLMNMNKFIRFILIALLLLSWLKFDYLLLTNPQKAPLPEPDKVQYFQEWSAGYGIKEIVNYLKDLPKDQQILVATEGSFGTLPDGLQIYFFKTSNIKVIGLGFPPSAINHHQVQSALNQGHQVFLVGNLNRFTFGNQNQLELISQYPRQSDEQKIQTLMFYQLKP